MPLQNLHLSSGRSVLNKIDWLERGCSFVVVVVVAFSVRYKFLEK